MAIGSAILIIGATLPGSSGAAERVVLKGSAPSWASASREQGPARGEVDLSVTLGLRAEAELDGFNESVSDPTNPSYGQYLSPGEFRARFAPTEAAVQDTRAWLRSMGLEPTGVSKGRTLVDAQGSTRDVERAFGTDLRRYRYRGHSLRAPSEPISIPASLEGEVVGVLGLDDTFAVPGLIGPDSGPPAPVFRNAPPCSRYWAAQFAQHVPPAYGGQPPFVSCGYTPHELQGAYGIERMIQRGVNGAGEKVAVLDAFNSPTIRQDVAKYSRKHGLPKPKIRITKFPGRECHVGCALASRQGWWGEQTLDIEAVHSMAPRAKIHYVAGTDPGLGLTHALSWTVDHRAARIVTNSYGYLGEAISQGPLRTQEQIFKQAVAEGIGMYFSSGDDGDEFANLGIRLGRLPSLEPPCHRGRRHHAGDRPPSQLPLRGRLGDEEVDPDQGRV